ncbi:hypothetical protein ACFX15_039487 [Malus domestica]
MSINYLLVILIFASPFGVIFAVPTAESSNSPTLDECRKYFSVKCELEVSKSIFKEAVVSDGCCYLLVSLAKQCHDLFVNEAIASRPNVHKSQASIVTSMERPEGYPQVDDIATYTEPSSTSTSFSGTKNDMSQLESGLLRRNVSDLGDSYYRFQSQVGKSVDPKLLALVEFFRELYFRRLELFKKIFPGIQDKFLEVPKKLHVILAQVKPDETKLARTMQRSLSVGSPRDFKGGESKLRLERFKVRTIDTGDGVEQGGLQGSKPAK